jgi:hypothetical protein
MLMTIEAMLLLAVLWQVVMLVRRPERRPAVVRIASPSRCFRRSA